MRDVAGGRAPPTLWAPTSPRIVDLYLAVASRPARPRRRGAPVAGASTPRSVDRWTRPTPRQARDDRACSGWSATRTSRSSSRAATTPTRPSSQSYFQAMMWLGRIDFRHASRRSPTARSVFRAAPVRRRAGAGHAGDGAARAAAGSSSIATVRGVRRRERQHALPEIVPACSRVWASPTRRRPRRWTTRRSPPRSSPAAIGAQRISSHIMINGHRQGGRCRCRAASCCSASATSSTRTCSRTSSTTACSRAASSA